ncbi:bifunctional metallophosphatase/5'-nucleotidase [Piscinibacter sp. XHJ-5]|uniref:bifunctional metallophosphatase/5'-nucleotidase n=1 Tax=Piscinibacter sp. XHJ-5 TaxID=3037797 RepID=UPI0024534532|nr:bifunctional metallophosphatase/5'-nucleotidase [Piscinibacter sp. XHJ-5]
MPKPRALLACALAATLALPALADDARGNSAAARRPFTVKIIGFNDYHGNLQTPGTFGQNTAVPFAQRPAVGGAEYLGAYIARMKAANPLNVVVGAGDFVSASPLISALFFDEPAVETLNRIGVEFTSVGNHEFDHGAAELLRLQNGGCKITNGVQDPNSCQGALVGTPVPFEGARFKWLSANVVSTASGKPLLPAYGVKAFKGVRIAFIGMTLKGTPQIVTPIGVAGLGFLDEADTVNALIPKLRQQGIEAIVVLVHQGGFQSAGLSDINGCDGDLATSDIAKIVSRLDNAVDLVISGHTHAAYNCSAGTVDAKSVNGIVTQTPRPTGLPNAAGRLVPVTSASAFGRVLTDIDVTLDPLTRRMTAVHATNRLVDRTDPEIDQTIAANPTIKNIVTAYNGLVSPIANRVIGSITATLANSADASGNMPAAELIADSQLASTAPANFGTAQIAFMNPGGVRASFTFASSAAGEGDGNVTYGEAFTVQPFGNSLVTLTLGAQDVKNVLEQQFAGCRGQTQTRMLIPAAGLKYTWDSTKGCDARISDVRLVNANGAVVEQIVDGVGAVVSPARTYRVTVNNFLSTGGDGFTSFNNGSNRLGGAQDIDALTAYLAGFKLPDHAPYDPAAAQLQKPRITRLP